MKKSNTSDRLKYYLNINNLKQVDVLNKVEQAGYYISKSALSQYINGKTSPDQEKLSILSEILKVNETWLMGYDVPMELGFKEAKISNLIPMPELNKKVPLLGEIAAGVPILADENVEMYVELDRTVQADFCLRVKGDSMINANIRENDIVFIRKQSDVDDGDIAAVLIDDEATLKRVYKMGGQVILRAENPKYEPITLNGDKSVYILGRATYKLSEIL